MNNILKKSIALLFTFLLIILIFDPVASNNPLKYPLINNLNNSKISFIGENTNDEAGSPIVNIGDVNGDDYDDFLISAIFNSDNGFWSGKIYLFFGKSSGWKINTSLNAANVSFIGEHAYDVAGSSISGVGDVNGDGFDDFLIGAPGNSDNGKGAGKTYLFFGKATGWKSNTMLSEADVIFLGEKSNDCSGWSIASAGDVNADGYNDFLIGANGNCQGQGSNNGTTYLVLGKSTGWNKNNNLINADASFIGEEPLDRAGISVTGTGDVNKDGYDDFLIGADMNSQSGYHSGKSYLIFGKRNGWSRNISLHQINVSFLGSNVNDQSGDRLAGGGDVNRDGYADILIGAWTKTNYTGCVYLIFGKSKGWAKDVNLSTADSSFCGENILNAFGQSFSNNGDINGDGYDDIIIGAFMNSSNMGQSYLFFGKSNNWTKNMNLSQADTTFIGEHANDYSGVSVSNSGDYNGDGHEDILIGADWNSDTGYKAGKTYLLFLNINSKPKSISSVGAYDKTYSTKISSSKINESVYIQLNGTDGNSSTQDIAQVNIKSKISDSRGFILKLFETGSNTGIYRGNFSIKEISHETSKEIRAMLGEQIIISSLDDPSKNVTILVDGPIFIYPNITQLNALEDAKFNIHFWVPNLIGGEWNFSANANWLLLDNVNHNISGIPNNKDVGTYDIVIKIKISTYTFKKNYSLIVINIPPKILTKDIINILQDQEYYSHYFCDDDKQGIITWHLKTDASWLNLNRTTGILKGKPLIQNLGSYWINISVDDGNDGWDYHNFTLTVNKKIIGLIITTIDVDIAYKNKLYYVKYNVSGINSASKSLFWSLNINASWLEINSTSGELFGTPSQKDIGQYLIIVTVRDNIGDEDNHKFNLTVVDINEPPILFPIGNQTLEQNENFKLHINAIDEDPSDIGHLKFSVKFLNDIPFFNLSIDGYINFTVTQSMVGNHNLLFIVTDLIGNKDQQEVIFIILNVNDPPILQPIENQKINRNTSFQLKVNATDPDFGYNLQEKLIFSDNTSLFNIDKNTGWINFTSTKSDAGLHFIEITVLDHDNASSSIQFKFEIILNNTAPKVKILISDNLTSIKEGKTFILTAQAIDYDNDPLTYKWFDNNNVIGTGMSIEIRDVKPKKHIFNLMVSDGITNTTVSYEIYVKQKSSEDNIWFNINIIILICFILGIIINLKVRKFKSLRKKKEK